MSEISEKTNKNAAENAIFWFDPSQSHHLKREAPVDTGAFRML